jgi:hypothetical protein
MCCVEGRATKRCSGCESVWYCDLECQKADWPRHKNECHDVRAIKTKGVDGLFRMVLHAEESHYLIMEMEPDRTKPIRAISLQRFLHCLMAYLEKSPDALLVSVADHFRKRIDRPRWHTVIGSVPIANAGPRATCYWRGKVYPRYLWVLLTTNKEEVATRSRNECGIDLTTETGWELNLGYLRHQTGTAVAIRVDGAAAPDQAHPYAMDYPIIPARQVADAFHSDIYSTAFLTRSTAFARGIHEYLCKGPINLNKGLYLVLMVFKPDMGDAKDANPFSAPVGEVGDCIDRLLEGHKAASGDAVSVTEAEVYRSWILAVLVGPRGLTVERPTLLRHFLVCIRPVA